MTFSAQEHVQKERARQKTASEPSADKEAPGSFYWTLDDIAALEPPEWLIEGIVPAREKGIIFGESGHYKSILAVDRFCRLAHGMDYHGIPVTRSCPAVFIANEDPRGLAVHHIQGWHRYHGKPAGRVIVVHAGVKLDTPENVEKVITEARRAFGDERPVFVVDTWDRSITGNQNNTVDVNPALDGLEALLEAGAATSTISHSPWSTQDRTKGAVIFWANHNLREKASKDDAGRATLAIKHQKHGTAGFTMMFEFEQFDFDVIGGMASTLIPRRIDIPAEADAGGKAHRMTPTAKKANAILWAMIKDSSRSFPMVDRPGFRCVLDNDWEAECISENGITSCAEERDRKKKWRHARDELATAGRIICDGSRVFPVTSAFSSRRDSRDDLP